MALIKCKECGAEMSKNADKCPNCGNPAKKKTSLFTWIIAGFFGLVFIGMFNSPSTTSTSAPRVDPIAQAIEKTKIQFSWNKAGFGNVMEANFIIKNNGSRAIKDIKIKCTHYAKSGTKVDSNTKTIFDIVKPTKQKSFKKVNMGFMHSQTSSSACSIIGLKLI